MRGRGKGSGCIIFPLRLRLLPYNNDTVYDEANESILRATECHEEQDPRWNKGAVSNIHIHGIFSSVVVLAGVGVLDLRRLAAAP